MSLTINRYGTEASWTFGSCSSAQTYANQQEYTESCCLNSGEHTLTCKDSFGDGWHGGFIEIDGTKYCDDFVTGYNTTRQITIEGKYFFKHEKIFLINCRVLGKQYTIILIRLHLFKF